MPLVSLFFWYPAGMGSHLSAYPNLLPLICTSKGETPGKHQEQGVHLSRKAYQYREKPKVPQICSPLICTMGREQESRTRYSCLAVSTDSVYSGSPAALTTMSRARALLRAVADFYYSTHQIPHSLHLHFPLCAAALTTMS